MPCFTPLKAYKAPGGGIAFDSKRGYGDRPLELPCGQCIGCRVARSRQWALRCVHEAAMHERNCFVTLTYSPESLPADGSLNVKHWQKFAKRLRKNVGKFRFFHCGEYGDRNLRPHYHACIFGMDFSDDRRLWSKSGVNRLYVSDSLSDTWKLGFATVGSLTYESAAYVARYVMKKRTGPQAAEHYERVNPETGEVFSVVPEYVTMSRRPGIGATWFEKYVDDVFPRDEVVYQGRKFRVPRYYDDLLERRPSGPSLLLDLKAKRCYAAGQHSEDLTPDRLRDREFCAKYLDDGIDRPL